MVLTLASDTDPQDLDHKAAADHIHTAIIACHLIRLVLVLVAIMVKTIHAVVRQGYEQAANQVVLKAATALVTSQAATALVTGQAAVADLVEPTLACQTESASLLRLQIEACLEILVRDVWEFGLIVPDRHTMAYILLSQSLLLAQLASHTDAQLDTAPLQSSMSMVSSVPHLDSSDTLSLPPHQGYGHGSPLLARHKLEVYRTLHADIRSRGL